MMFDAYLVDLLAQKDVLTDRLTDRRTFAFLELLSQLKIAMFLIKMTMSSKSRLEFWMKLVETCLKYV